VRLHALSLAVFALVVFQPAASTACLCLGQAEHPCAFMSRADLAIVATALEVTSEIVSGESFLLYRFAVSRVFKGDSAGQLIVRTSENSSCGVRFKLGERYLVFAYAIDGDYHTDYCAGSRLLGDPSIDLSYLERKNDLHIHGRVVDGDRSGDSLGNLLVQISSDSRAWQVSTGPDGHFELGGLVPGAYVVSVIPTNAFEADGAPDTVHLTQGACGEVLHLVRRVRQLDTNSAVSFGLTRIEGEMVPGLGESIPAGFTPEGWVATDSAFGDLNGDRRSDVCLVIEPMDSSIDRRALIVLLARGTGFIEAVRSETAIPVGKAADPFRSRWDVSGDDPFDTIEIDRGCIDISFSNVGTGGRWWRYRFRYQRCDFFLIGATHGEGDAEHFNRYDYNLSTGVLSVRREKEKGNTVKVTTERKVRRLKRLPALRDFEPGRLGAVANVTL
jgi:hypothetical protein